MWKHQGQGELSDKEIDWCFLQMADFVNVVIMMHSLMGTSQADTDGLVLVTTHNSEDEIKHLSAVLFFTFYTFS